MKQIPKPYEVYRHFKGNLYQILSIAEHSETGEKLVIYQALYGEFKIYARELSMFMSPVDRTKYPDVKQQDRFELITAGVDGNVTNVVKVSDEKDKRQDSFDEQKTYRDARVTDASDAKAIDTSTSKVADVSDAKAIDTSASKVADVSDAKAIDTSASKASDTSDEGEGLDPMLVQFLDADSYEEKLNILTGVRHRITKEMLTTMAVACDIEIKEGSLDEQYDSLRQCLLTLEKYECNRLR